MLFIFYLQSAQSRALRKAFLIAIFKITHHFAFVVRLASNFVASSLRGHGNGAETGANSERSEKKTVRLNGKAAAFRVPWLMESKITSASRAPHHLILRTTTPTSTTLFSSSNGSPTLCIVPSFCFWSLLSLFALLYIAISHPFFSFFMFTTNVSTKYLNTSCLIRACSANTFLFYYYQSFKILHVRNVIV